MKFIVRDKVITKPEVGLTLEPSTDKHQEGMVYLKANGEVVMGFKDGKYRLFSDAREVKGLVLNGNLIVRDQTI